LSTRRMFCPSAGRNIKKPTCHHFKSQNALKCINHDHLFLIVILNILLGRAVPYYP
jgi:hypothetical protein